VTFLCCWQDADPDIPILKEAKAEYAKLQWLPAISLTCPSTRNNIPAMIGHPFRITTTMPTSPYSAASC
jgi:hypothetical protein